MREDLVQARETLDALNTVAKEASEELDKQLEAARNEILSQAQPNEEIRQQERQAVLKQLNEKAAQERAENPVVTGDLDSTLIHQFGSGAINRSASSALGVLNSKILQEAKLNPLVPVIMKYQHRYGGWNDPEVVRNYLALVLVDLTTTSDIFESSYKIEKDHPMHAFTRQTSDVEEFEYSLLGKTTIFIGDLLMSPYDENAEEFGKSETREKFRLIKDIYRKGGRGQGGGIPSTYAFNGYTENNIGKREEGDARSNYVGWDEIEKFVKDEGGFEVSKNIHRMFKELAVATYGPPESAISKVFRGLDEIDAITQRLQQEINSRGNETK